MRRFLGIVLLLLFIQRSYAYSLQSSVFSSNEDFNVKRVAKSYTKLSKPEKYVSFLFDDSFDKSELDMLDFRAVKPAVLSSEKGFVKEGTKKENKETIVKSAETAVANKSNDKMKSELDVLEISAVKVMGVSKNTILEESKKETASPAVISLISSENKPEKAKNEENEEHSVGNKTKVAATEPKKDVKNNENQKNDKIETTVAKENGEKTAKPQEKIIKTAEEAKSQVLNNSKQEEKQEEIKIASKSNNSLGDRIWGKKEKAKDTKIQINEKAETVVQNELKDKENKAEGVKVAVKQETPAVKENSQKVEKAIEIKNQTVEKSKVAEVPETKTEVKTESIKITAKSETPVVKEDSQKSGRTIDIRNSSVEKPKIAVIPEVKKEDVKIAAKLDTSVIKENSQKAEKPIEIKNQTQEKTKSVIVSEIKKEEKTESIKIAAKPDTSVIKENSQKAEKPIEIGSSGKPKTVVGSEIKKEVEQANIKISTKPEPTVVKEDSQKSERTIDIRNSSVEKQKNMVAAEIKNEVEVESIKIAANPEKPVIKGNSQKAEKPIEIGSSGKPKTAVGSEIKKEVEQANIKISTKPEPTVVKEDGQKSGRTIDIRNSSVEKQKNIVTAEIKKEVETENIKTAAKSETPVVKENTVESEKIIDGKSQTSEKTKSAVASEIKKEVKTESVKIAAKSETPVSKENTVKSEKIIDEKGQTLEKTKSAVVAEIKKEVKAENVKIAVKSENPVAKENAVKSEKIIDEKGQTPEKAKAVVVSEIKKEVKTESVKTAAKSEIPVVKENTAKSEKIIDEKGQTSEKTKSAVVSEIKKEVKTENIKIAAKPETPVVKENNQKTVVKNQVLEQTKSVNSSNITKNNEEQPVLTAMLFKKKDVTDGSKSQNNSYISEIHNLSDIVRNETNKNKIVPAVMSANVSDLTTNKKNTKDESSDSRLENVRIKEVLQNESIVYQEGQSVIDSINPKKQGNVNSYYPGLRGPHQLIVYTPSYGLRTGTNEFGTEAIVENNMVVRLNGADSIIPKNGLVISGHGKAKDWILKNIQIGSKIYVDYDNKVLKSVLTPESLMFAAKEKLKEVNGLVEYYRQVDILYNDKKANNCLENSKNALRKAEKKPEKTQAYIKEAMESLDEAIKNAIPYFSNELKGIWVRPVETTSEQIEKTVSRIASAGITDIFLETYFHGKTIYPSQYLKNMGVIWQRSEFKGMDPLEIWIREAHKRHMKVHVWFECFYVGNDNPQTTQNHVLRVYPTWANKRLSNYDSQEPVPSLSEHNGYFLDPASVQVQSYLLGVLNEIIEKYKPDGINLDYIRYPQTVDPSYSNYAQTNWGYTKVAREEFKFMYGIDPIDIKYGTSNWELWTLYRQNQITRFVKQVKALTAKTNINLTAVIFPDLKKSKYTKMQNWKVWSMNNYIDGFTPLLLTGDKNTANMLLQNVINNTKSSTKIYPGLFVTFMGGASDDLLLQIQKARELKSKGAVIFDYAHFDDKYIEALTTRVFNKNYESKEFKMKNYDSTSLNQKNNTENYKPEVKYNQKDKQKTKWFKRRDNEKN